MKTNSQKLILGLIILKIALLGTLMLRYFGALHFGEKILSAEETEASKAGSRDSEDVKNDSTTLEEEKKETRKGFLDDLLNLPKLDGRKMKKEEVARYLDLAERKEKQVNERIELLKKREIQLKDLEKSIDVKLIKLDEERKFILSTIQQEKDLKGERLNNLIAIYKKMEPKKAAPLFEKMEKDLAVEMFKQIPEKQLTAIMMKMNPEKSVELTEYFGRVKSLKEYDLLKEMNESIRKEFDSCKGMPKTADASDTTNKDTKEPPKTSN